MRFLAAASVALLVIVLVAGPAAASSAGALGSCDMTPVPINKDYQFFNGCYGMDWWGNPCASQAANPTMKWVRFSQPDTVYTLRSGDAPGNVSLVDSTTYIPGGTWNELHIRTLKLDRRWIGLLMYATNGTDALTKKETQVGTWKVLPATTSGFQVPPACPNAVTHNGAEVKPMHVRLWFSAPPGTGTVRFRIMLKEGTQGTGRFWFPAKALTLTEGKAPTPPPQNKPGVIVPVATGAEQKLSILGALGQTCTAACMEQRPATPFCHRKATVAISSSQAVLAAVGSQMDCTLPILAGCPYEGAARVTRTVARSTCTFRSQNAALSCPAWSFATTPAINAATLFASGTTSTMDRSSPLYVPDVCFTAPSADSQNICICTNNEAAQGANPFVQAAIAALNATIKATAQTKKIGEASQTSAAGRTSRAASSVLLGLLAAACGLSSSRVGGSKMVLLVLVALALLSLVSSPVSAHNYMRGLHRATEASVTKPCQTRLGNDPHVQIVAGQPFEMEWTNGHGNAEGQKKTYFVILHASAYDELKARNITDILRAYLNEAPTSALRFKKPDAAMWERQHRRSTNQLAGDDFYYATPKGLNSSDPIFIQVDPVYDEKTHPNPYSAAVLASAKAKIWQSRVHPDIFAQYGEDRRAVYESKRFPWIESVDEFINPYNRDNSATGDFFSHQGDIARFNFEARKGAGDYIAWYSWSGYGDCVDINVMPGTTAVKYRYGRNATELGAKQYAIKIDHCEIRNVPSAATMVRVLDRTTATHDATQCINECIDLGFNKCAAVQVVRAKNPPNTMEWEVNIPWIPYHWNQTGWNLDKDGSRDWPCRCMSVRDCKQRGCRRTSVPQAKYEGWSLGGEGPALTLANANADPTKYNFQDDDYVCYGTKPARNQDNQVEEDFVVADDPMDPVWYSTCYLTLTNGGYLNVPALETLPIDYLTNERCLGCDWHKQVQGLTMNVSPFWDKGLQSVAADQCADCSLRASAPPANTPTRAAQLSALAGADEMFVGYRAAADKAAYDAAVKAAAAAAAAAAAQPQPSTPTTGGGGGTPEGSNGGTDGASTESGDSAKGGGAAASSSSSSESKILGLAKVPGILVLVAIAVAGLLLLGGVAYAVHSCRSARRSSNSDLRRMQEAGGVGSTELQANPAFQRL